MLKMVRKNPKMIHKTPNTAQKRRKRPKDDKIKGQDDPTNEKNGAKIDSKLSKWHMFQNNLDSKLILKFQNSRKGWSKKSEKRYIEWQT